MVCAHSIKRACSIFYLTITTDFDDETIQWTHQTLADPNTSVRERLFLSSSLRNILGHRFEQTNSKAHLDGAIEAAETVISAASQMFLPLSVLRTVQAEANFELGQLLVEKRQIVHGQDAGELNYAIDCLEKASKGMKDPKRRAFCLNSLSGLLSDRNRSTSQLVDIERAVTTAKEVLQITPEDDLRFRPGRLFNYGSKLRALFEATKNEGLLYEALPQVEAALQLLPETREPQIWTRYKTEYAAIQIRMYETSGDVKYLNIGIESCDAVSLTCQGQYLSGNYGEYWNILAGLLRHRYDRLEVKEDIRRAINAAEDAVKALPDGHKDYGNRLANLSHMYWRRFSRYRERKDINIAITKIEKAISKTPDDHINKATHLSTLSGLLTSRYDFTKQDADINESVSLARKAVEQTPKDKLDYLLNRNNLARVLFIRANANSESPCLDGISEAIEAMRSVVFDTPTDEPNRAVRLNNISSMLIARYRITHLVSDLNEAVDHLDQCSRHSKASPTLQISAAINAADLLIAQSKFPDADVFLRRAVACLRKVSPRSLAQRDQQHMIRKFAGLATLATSIALEVEADAEDSLQLLEEGRGVILGLLFEVRSDVSDLKMKHPDLAADFERLRDELDAPATYGNPEAVMIEPEPSMALTRRENVVKEFDDKVEAIRREKDFHNFLQPPEVARLKSAASRGPTVVINVSLHRSDAFIIETNRAVEKLRLQNLHLDEIKEWAILLKSRNITEAKMFELLEWLWDNLAFPILSRLEGRAEGQVTEIHHIWWVLTGPLCSLPIHAAGKYTKNHSSPINLMDKVISSYSPSVKAMLFTQENKTQWNQVGSANKPLLVAMEKTSNLKSLTNALKEVEEVYTQLATVMASGESPTILREPKKSDVLAKLSTAMILHFAGHGKSDPADPLQSALLVEDWEENPLTVKDLMSLKLHQNPPLLAYLSACSTGTNKVDDLLDEGLHLMSACQLVGFQHVIGSLWEVSDRHCVEVARTVFAKMVNSQMSDSSVSLGLQEGVKSLRDKRRPSYGISRDDEDGDDVDETDVGPSADSETDTGRDGFGVPMGVFGRSWLGGDPRVWAAYIHIGR
jgi:CHAT domain-containing protein